MSFKSSPVSAVDSYKLSHMPAYPQGTTWVCSNLTPRSLNHLNVPEEYKRKNEIVLVGHEATVRDLIEFWNEEFFAKSIDDVIEKFSNLIIPFAGLDYSTEHLRALHKVGYLPLEIRMLDEGTRVPVGIPTLSVSNTKEEFFWLTNYIESDFSAEIWKTPTAATIIDVYRQIGHKYYELTGADKNFMSFAFHDFSYRGCHGRSDAHHTGTGHLSGSLGTDTIPAVEYINYHYKGKYTFVGCSVPAMEHSVQCAYGDDVEYFRNVVTKAYPKGIVSVVCDGYDYWSVLTNVLPQLKDEILSREVNELGLAKVVIRPDSGDPADIICGKEIRTIMAEDFDNFKRWAKENIVHRIQSETDHGEQGEWDVTETFKWNVDGKYYNVNVYIEWSRYDKQYYFVDGSQLITVTEVQLTPEEKGSLELLWETFGGTINDEGYKVLNPRIGLIYGDSITPARAEEIYSRMAAKKFSADNIVLGIGSYTYSYNTRDTLGWAIKATATVQNGELIALFKDPKTDKSKVKKSAKGLIRVVEKNGKLVKYDEQTIEQYQSKENLLKVFYKDGIMQEGTPFATIRERINRAYS